MFYFETVSEPSLRFLSFCFLSWYTTDKESLTYVKKMNLFKQYLLTQPFISTFVFLKSCNYINEMIRKHYLAKKYAKQWITYFICKKPFINSTDLELNPFNDRKLYVDYIDYEEKKRYRFSVNEFIKMVRINLEHCYIYDLVPEPMPIKNPYNNKIFTTEELLRFNVSFYQMPLVWHLFVDSGFNISKMKDKHYQYLSTICIPSFIDQLEEDDIVFYIEDIFGFYSITTYCKKCIQDKKHLRHKIVRDTLIQWIQTIKFSLDNVRSDNLKGMLNLLSLYDVECPIHNKKLEILKKRRLQNLDSQIVKNIDINYTGYLDLSKPFEFTMGTYTKEDQSRYKDKRREKNRLKKKYKSKTIE